MNRIDWDRQPFGELSDAQLAAVLGCTKQAVQEQRRRRAPDVQVRRGRPATPAASEVARRIRTELAVIDLLEECTGGLTDEAIADELELELAYCRSVLVELLEAGVLRAERDRARPLDPRLWSVA